MCISLFFETLYNTFVEIWPLYSPLEPQFCTISARRHLVASLHQVIVSLCNWSIFARLVSWKDVPVFVLWCNPPHVVLLWRYMPLRGRAKCCSFKIDSEVCIVRKIFLLDLVISRLIDGPTYEQASTFPVSRAVSIAVNAFWLFALIYQVVVLKVSQLCSPLLGGWKIFVTSAVGRLNRYCLPFAGSSFYHFSFPLLLSFLVWSDEIG